MPQVHSALLVLLIQHSVLFSQDWVPLDKGFECFFPSANVQWMYFDSISSELIVTGSFREDANCVAMTGSARWNGIKWDSTQNFYTAGINKYALTRFNDTLLMSGSYFPPGGYYQLAKWSGSTWDTLPNSPNSLVTSFAERNGELYMAGCFDRLGSDSTFLLGKYDGQTFSGCTPFEGDNTSLGYRATCLAFYHDTLYMGGDFTTSTNGPASDFARYVNGILDTVHQQFIGNGASSYIEDMVVFRDELYIAGYFRKQDGFTGDYIMKWDGHQFSEVGGGVNGRVNTLAVHNDRLYVGGYFTQAGDSATSLIAIWDGVTWQTFHDTFPGNTIIRDIAFYRDSLIISGNFRWINGDTVNHIAKYNHALPTMIEPVPPFTSSVSVYPNPASDQVTFKFSDEQHSRAIIIYDAFGKEVWREETNQTVLSVSVQDFAEGVYFYTINTENGELVQGKFLVQ